MPQEETPPTPGTLKELTQNIATANAPPLLAARAIQKWREKAASDIDNTIPDVSSRWKAKNVLDDSVSSAIEEQRNLAMSQWAGKSFTSPEDAKSFTSQFLAVGGDPDKMPPQLQDLAHQANSFNKIPAFQDTRESRNTTPGTIKSGDTTLAQYSYRNGSDGKTEVLISPRGSGDQTLPDVPVKIATPTDKEVQDARDQAIKAAADAQSLFDKQKASMSSDPDDAAANAAAMSQPIKDLREATAKAHALAGPHGKDVLIADRVKEAVKAPEFSDKVGQFHRGEDFVKGLGDATFQAGALLTRPYDIATGGSATKDLSEAQQAMDTVGGSTRQDVTGDFYDRNITSGVRGLGAMAPALVAGPIAKAAGAVTSATSIGASGVLMGLGAAGGAELQAEQRLSGLDAQRADAVNRRITALSAGDQPAADQAQAEINAADSEAQRVKSGRDVNALLTGGLMGGISKISPLHNLALSSTGLKSFMLDVGKQAVEMPGLTIGNKLIDAATYGDNPELTADELKGSAFQGATMGLMLGGLAKIHQQTLSRLGAVDANEQQATATAKAAGATDPETLGALQGIHEAQRQNIQTEAQQQAIQHVQSLQVAANDMAVHQAKMEEIKGSTDPSVASQLAVSDFGDEPTKGQRGLQEIQGLEIRRHQLDLAMHDVAQNENMSAPEREEAMKPLASERKQVELKLVKLPFKLEAPHAAALQDISPETGKPGNQAPEQAPGGNQNGKEEVKVPEVQNVQGQESGRRSQEDEQNDAVTVRPATAGAPGEPLPPSPIEASSPSGTPEPRPAEPAPEAPPAQTAASTESSQGPASVDPNSSKGGVKTVDTVPEGPDPETALNHAQIDADRVRLGMQPIVKQASQAFGGHIDEAARLGLEAARQTMRDLKAEPRPHTTLEQAQMFLLKDHLERRLAEASDRFNNAPEGDARDQAAKEIRDASDQLQDLHEANYHSGSETGRALGMRRYMMDKDEIPPLPVVLAKLAIAKGEPLTPDEKAYEAAQHRGALEAKADADTDQERVERNAMAQMIDQIVGEMEKEIPGNLPKEPAKPIRDLLAKKAEEARAAIRKNSGGVSMLGAKDLENLPHYAVILASHIADALGSVKDGLTRFVKEFPGLAKEFVKEILGNAQSINAKVDERLAKVSKLAKDQKGLGPEGVILKRKGQVAQGPIDPAIARELMKAHIRGGVTDVQDLTTKLTASIKQLYPDATEKDVRMAVTGLGKTSEPSKDPTAKKMADFRTQMALIENIRRLKEESLSPLKRGDQRQKASDKARELQRQLNEEMRKAGYSSQGPMDLRGRLDALKQGLRNQIADLEDLLSGRRGKVEAKGLPVERDAEWKSLKERLDNLKGAVANVPEFKAQLAANENERAITAAKKSRDEYNRRIQEKEFEAKNNPSKQVSADLRRMRAERDDAGQRFRDLRAGSDVGRAETLRKQRDAAVAAVEAKEQALRDNLPPNKKPEDVFKNDQALKLARERAAELNKELAKQRYGDGMDALHDWARNRKKELQDRLDGKPSATGEERPKPTGTEADAIRAEIRDMEKQVRSKEAPARVLKSIKDRIDKLQKKIDTKDLSRRTPEPRPDTPEIKDAQEQLDKLHDIYETMQKADGTRDNEAYRKRLDAQMTRMQDNEVKGFPKQVKPVLALDAESESKKAKVAEFRRGFEQRRYDAEQAKRHAYEKAFDTATGTIRGFKLSRVATLAKLALFSAYKLGSTPLEEMTGAGVSKVFSSLADKATTEGRGNLGNIATFYHGFFGQGMRDAGHAAKPILAILTGGRLGDLNAHSPLKDLYGKSKPRSTPRWYDIPQILHEVEKAPLLRASFEMAKQKLVENAKATGRAVTPDEIGQEAYEQAKRAILMADNLYHSAIQAGIKRFDQPNKTGHTPFIGKLGGFIGTSLATFTKVASNHFVLLFNHVAGMPVGASRLLGHALAGSLAEMHPDVANSIMRQMKQGSPGMGMLLLGMAAPQMFGGMNVSKKRKDDEPGFGEITVNGVKIPRTVSMSNPLLMAAQIGATITQTAHSKLRKKDKEEQGMAAGALAGVAGVAESGPLVNEASHVGDLMKGEGLRKWAGNWLKGNIVPGLLDEIAQATDRANGTPVKRQMNGVLDTLQGSVPGLREQLPVAKAKRH